MTAPRTCRRCGCTDADCSGCVARTGKPCHWVEVDLCSACMGSSWPPRFADLRELRDLGVLQEANRQFFHPLGLALVFEFDTVHGDRIAGIFDSREDPQGCMFEPALLSPKKAAAVAALRARFVKGRIPTFGSVIQPLPPREPVMRPPFPLQARVLRDFVLDPEGEPIPFEAGTKVQVVDLVTTGATFGAWVIEHQGRQLEMPIDELELVHAAPGIQDVGKLINELMEALASTEEAPEGAAHPEAPGASSASLEPPPTTQDVLDLLQNLEQAQAGGELSREEFEARKKQLLARIRRHQEGRS
jgi:hypothetical protein